MESGFKSRSWAPKPAPLWVEPISAEWVSPALSLIQQFHASLKNKSSNLGLENSADITFPVKRTLTESRVSWERNQKERPRALPGYGEGELLAGGDIRAGVLKDE